MKQLSEQVSVSEQLHVCDLQALKDSGVDVVVCNRPEGESTVETTEAPVSKRTKPAKQFDVVTVGGRFRWYCCVIQHLEAKLKGREWLAAPKHLDN